MSSEVEISRSGAIPSSTLPEVVLAADEYDYGMNLITTMAARRENIAEMGPSSTTTTIGSKVMDLRDVHRSSRSSSVANSPGSVLEEVTSGRLNDSEGVSFIDDNNVSSATSNNISNIRTNNSEDVPINVSESESFAVEDTDTDDDVILVVQPIETIELLGDDDDADVQIVNSDEPIPKPKRLPQQQLPKLLKNVMHGTTSSSSSTSTSTNTMMSNEIFPAPPRLPEPSVSTGLGMFQDDEHLAPILKDLLDDHFGGQIDFDLQLPMQMPTEHPDFSMHNRTMDYSKPTRGLFVSHFTTEMGIQTDVDFKPEKKDMETQTENSTFCGKRKL